MLGMVVGTLVEYGSLSASTFTKTGLTLMRALGMVKLKAFSPISRRVTGQPRMSVTVRLSSL